MLLVELKVLEGRQQGKTIPLNVRQFLIGREQDCHLRPNSDLVSRHHCVFTVDDFTLRLRDLGSTNGTLVNGERIQGQVVLNPGDHVSVGNLSFEIVVREAAAVAANNNDSSPAPTTPVPQVEAHDTEVNVTDTVEFPVNPVGDDTAIIDTFPPPGPPQQLPPMQHPAFLPSMAYPPGYGMPQGYAMPGYAPGYPGGYQTAPGYPPGYGPPPGYMPAGYGMQPMMQPMPAYGMPPVQSTEPAPPAPTEYPTVTLPDPSQTGAKAPVPPPPPPPPVEGEAGAAPIATPSNAAADIIRSHRNRRP